jgi:hypothetical protein
MVLSAQITVHTNINARHNKSKDQQYDKGRISQAKHVPFPVAFIIVFIHRFHNCYVFIYTLFKKDASSCLWLMINGLVKIGV